MTDSNTKNSDNCNDRNLSALFMQFGNDLNHHDYATPASKENQNAALNPQHQNGRGLSKAVNVKSPVITSASTLRTKPFPPLKFGIPGVVPEGLSILAGKPKIGKSWLMLDMALSISTGANWWGGPACEQGNVLYLALEDNERRLQSRITKLLGHLNEWPIGMYYATEWPRANEGDLDQIRAWLDKARRPRFIGIDVLARFRAPRDGGQSPYDCDYESMTGLQRIASEYSISIVGAHHVRKNSTEMDPFEQVSGTLGLTGGVDTILVLQRDSNGMTLHGRGRDMPEIEKAVNFDQGSCRWHLLGDTDSARRSDERAQIMSVLIEAGAPLARRQIALVTGMPPNNLDQLLHKMVRAGEIAKQGRALYINVNRPSSE